MSHGGGEYRDFNKFIDDAEVDHIPMIGRRYTWYRSNGKAWSRLDRVLMVTHMERKLIIHHAKISLVIVLFLLKMSISIRVVNLLGHSIVGGKIEILRRW